MHRNGRFAGLMIGALLLQPVLACAQVADGCYRGINLSGAEFGKPPGQINKTYVYPSERTVTYFAAQGFDTVRLPFKWERLQPDLFGPLNADELARIDKTLALLRGYAIRLILDPHNYAHYAGDVIGSEKVPVAAFADFWGRLAKHYAGQPDVVFGLMNEPSNIGTPVWVEAANAAIKSIRDTGADNIILVPGTHWTGAHSWFREEDGKSHAAAMLEITDPGANFAYEVHQYFDADFSGTKGTCDRAADAVKAVSKFTGWLKDNGKRGFLGEFGVPGAAPCVSALGDMVGEVADNPDVWTGWTYWVAGDWWSRNEPLNIQPTKDGDRPQLAGLKPFLDAPSAACAALKR
ncbi:glycoside hydrolase family 5 protein [Rhizobium halophytocola]|uniref:Endoglucanase n=1 Tax=Rhizobium halophytocola TaxID=735519 RepID=A0ABS4E249_9HYPH|nr:glycoside hydrolase family 5 protein [Rhizobium halophytocola]MBP1852029.1 endoglucanase [Rhizobium halophytocola]